MTDLFYVKYKMGLGSYAAGPYELTEAQEQLRDIQGYSGVSDAYIQLTPDRRPKTSLPEKLW